MSYTGRIIREQGASVLRVASGGSMTFDSGGQLGGTVGGNPTFADNPTFSGTPVFTGGVNFTGVTATCIGASKLKLASDVAASGTAGIFEVFDFGNGVKFFVSKSNSTTSAAGSPGSLLLHLAGGGGGSGARLYIKAGDNSPASAGWTKIRLDLASS